MSNLDFEKPDGWDKASAMDRLTYKRKVEAADKRANAALDTIASQGWAHPSVYQQNKPELEARYRAMSPLERQRFDLRMRERVAASNGGKAR
jgi:hypothetical protein